MAKILLIDDEEDILFLLERTFTKAGHVVVSTSDPRRALPLICNGSFDAIVLDVMMPEISGWDLLSQIRERKETKSIPILMLTALSSVSDRVRGLRGGADDYLTKPFEPDELVARVEALVHRRAASAAGPADPCGKPGS
jgi:DNA-binding response OmpR family regulator